MSLYQAVSTAAKTSLEVQQFDNGARKNLEIAESDVSYDSETSKLGTWDAPDGRVIRVFVESKAGIELR
jgi:hypothetical protein